MADSITKLANLDVSRVKPNPRNAKTHSAEQIALIASSMLDFGWTQPVVVDEANVVLAGHARLEAAKTIWSAGQAIPGTEKGIVPVVIVTGLSEVQKRAYMLADNKLPQHSGAGWDLGVLQQEAAFLIDEDVNLLGLGFAEDDFRLFDGDDSNLGANIELPEPAYSPPPAPAFQPTAQAPRPAPYQPQVQPVASPPAPADTFRPTLNPVAQPGAVTAKAVERAEGQLARQYENAGRQDLIAVACPHCLKEFNIERT